MLKGNKTVVKNWIGSAIVISNLLLATTGVFSPKAVAGTMTEIQLSGTVEPALKLVATSTPISSVQVLSNISLADQQMQQVAQLAISTNSEQEYDLKVTASILTNVEGKTIPVQVILVKPGAEPTSVQPSATSNLENHAGTNIVVSETQNLLVQYESTPPQKSEVYSGTISLLLLNR